VRILSRESISDYQQGFALLNLSIGSERKVVVSKSLIWQTHVVVGRPAGGAEQAALIRSKLDVVSAVGWELVAASRENSHHFLFFRAVAQSKPPFEWADS
jgi:hypothetical protein